VEIDPRGHRETVQELVIVDWLYRQEGFGMPQPHTRAASNTNNPAIHVNDPVEIVKNRSVPLLIHKYPNISLCQLSVPLKAKRSILPLPVQYFFEFLNHLINNIVMAQNISGLHLPGIVS
jgi:hypothetical protein